MLQTPSPGTELIFHCGDSLKISLETKGLPAGQAFVRTNLGRAGVRRREIISQAETGQPILDHDWHDIPMEQIDEHCHTLTLALAQTGYFRAKAFFLDHTGKVHWPEGENICVKVEPAETCCMNTIYTLFPRQFGRNLRLHGEVDNEKQARNFLTGEGYAAIPPSGKFRDVIPHLDFIINKLRCRIIQLLPIHPTPTVYGRMGDFGSPFAALDFFNVDPSYAEFDTRATPMEQFMELLDAVHARNARLFIDLPANHTGWASIFQSHHPEWFRREANGAYRSPGAWGVVWEDLVELDYSHNGLWHLLADVFLFWCRKGVDGFRCDAGYMVPVPVWKFIVSRVREEFPDTVFLLEGLGGPLQTMRQLLSEANLNWAYSELFQNYDQNAISYYLPSAIASSLSKGTLVHFAETHDNNRLAAVSKNYSRMRCAMSALFSDCGTFGITNGVEWFADEKFDVHGAPSLRWGASENQVDFLSRLHVILQTQPAFHSGARLELIQRGNFNTLAMLRSGGGQTVLVLVNLNPDNGSTVCWSAEQFSADEMKFTDLVGGAQVIAQRENDCLKVGLEPAQVLCLVKDEKALAEVEKEQSREIEFLFPDKIRQQRLRHIILNIFQELNGKANLAKEDLERMARQFGAEPQEFLRRFAEEHDYLLPFTKWTAGRDQRRCVLVPAGHFLLIIAKDPFLCEVRNGEVVTRRSFSIPDENSGHFALLNPVSAPSQLETRTIHLRLFAKKGIEVSSSSILLLPKADIQPVINLSADAGRLRSETLHAICSNDLGGMAQVRGRWAELRTKYDAFLAANPDPEVPVDRRIMLTRLRAWVVNRGYSRELSPACQIDFSAAPDNRVSWSFDVPVGMGRKTAVDVVFCLEKEGNACTIDFSRRQAKFDDREDFSDEKSVFLIIRPDVEDRINHQETKAFLGAESAFPAAISQLPDGFIFNPSGNYPLQISASAGSFVKEPEWQYMVELTEDRARGFEGQNDLFSPGYFNVELFGGQTVRLRATAGEALGDCRVPLNNFPPKQMKWAELLPLAMDRFIVRRGKLKTVIAGYPWFLDWGRDTLICLRGIIAAERLEEARQIILEFAGFEENGTLPNMIRGRDSSDRQTSDAPLWLALAVNDYIMASASTEILQAECGKRCLGDVLVSIAKHYRDGAPNGVKMDSQSGLIFSPSHFTWMDTNYPAGTPREGYPVEIQAFWIATLRMLQNLKLGGSWVEIIEQAEFSLKTLFVNRRAQFLSDCLHANPGISAKKAVADDHCRPNQLFAITLGAIEANSQLAADIISSSRQMLIPGGIRSLDDSSVEYELPVYWRGQLLNNPRAPYWGYYSGDEDTRRKPAYHNGTAWSWPFPSLAEAMLFQRGQNYSMEALAILYAAKSALESNCIGQMPEIFDANSPHFARGCGAQAWGITELYRVWKKAISVPLGEVKE